MPVSGASVTVFDGQDTIGGTKILLEQGEDRLLVDFGTNYQRMSRYYEEYLQPRPSRGITDYLALGLLPELGGAYRADLFPAGDFPEGDRGWAARRPTAVLLSHGHLDHAGGLAFLDPSIPVVCSAPTLALLRSWQESGGSGLSREVTYLGSHAPTAGGSKVGDSQPGRILATDRSLPRSGRRFQVWGEVPGALRREIERSPFAPRTKFEPSTLEPAPERFGAFRVSAHEVDHSVYGARGFLVEADGGTIAYSGDLRFHGERGAATEEFTRLLERRHPDLLLVEGTRLLPEGARDPPRVGEEQVERNCRAAVEGAEGRLVVADFGPRNIERLRCFRRIAQATGRELVVTPKDAYVLELLNAADPSVEIDLAPGGMRILEEPSAGRENPWLAEVRRRFADAHVTPEYVTGRAGRILLCFSFFDCNDLVDLRKATAGGLWLYSSSEAHGEEQEFDFVRLSAWIRWAQMRPLGFRLERGSDGRERPSFAHPDDVGHHASGHASQPELLEFIRRASPRRIVPVHTAQTTARYARLVREAGCPAEVLEPRPGIPIPL